MKRTVIISAFALFIAANAAAGPPDPLHKEILGLAQGAKKGVIVAVTERGEIAAETAWLLSAQVTRDDGYAPLLVALKPEERQQVLKSLKLRDSALPALIFYDRNGREINRVVGALPSRLIKQAHSSGSELN